MVDCQIRTFGVTDQRLIERFLAVPREPFLPDDLRMLAYSDIGFTLAPEAAGGEPRYLLPPLILARLMQGGRIRARDRVLDVAGGSGYSAALLSGLAASVVALESDGARCAAMTARLAQVGAASVAVREGDLAAGSAADGPFDVILVNGTIETNLDSLLAQLAPGGRLLAIRRSPTDPTGRAAKAVAYEKAESDIGTRVLFDATAPVLTPFRAVKSFVF